MLTSNERNDQHLLLSEFQKEIDFEVVYEKNPNADLAVPSDPNIRLLNWNIERGYNPRQLANYIQANNPDIVSLQEVDWHNERTDNRDVLEFLARETGMKGYFGVEFLEIASPLRDRLLAGGGVHGNAILTKIRPTAVYRIELPLMFDWSSPPAGTKLEVACQTRLGSRFALCADFIVGAGSLTVCSVHLEDNLAGVEGRITQLTHLVKNLETLTKKSDAAIIAGDLNTLETWLVRLFNKTKAEPSQSKPWYVSEAKWLMDQILPGLGYRDPFSYKSWTYMDSWVYREKLDWILIKNAAVRASRRGQFNSSDHRPLCVDLTITGL